VTLWCVLFGHDWDEAENGNMLCERCEAYRDHPYCIYLIEGDSDGELALLLGFLTTLASIILAMVLEVLM